MVLILIIVHFILLFFTLLEKMGIVFVWTNIIFAWMYNDVYNHKNLNDMYFNNNYFDSKAPAIYCYGAF